MESQEDKQSQEQTVVFAGSGKPFKTEKAAISAIKQKGIDPVNCKIVPQLDDAGAAFGFGYVVIEGDETTTTTTPPPPTTTLPPPAEQAPPNIAQKTAGHVVKEDTYYEGETVLQTIYLAPGKPFPSVKAANDFIRNNRINSGTNRIIKIDDNQYAIYGDGQAAPKPHMEKYFKVTFQARASENDPEDVSLSVNGETLVIQRETEVIIPGRFKECADHALILKFKQLPDQPRKFSSPIRTFPYSLIGEATEAEYIKQKTAGDKSTKHNVSRFGYNVTPEMVEGT